MQDVTRAADVGARLIEVAPARIPLDWPNRAFSRSVVAGRLDWHVQVAGRGPPLVLLHGAGSSAHSWAQLLPALASVATVVAPDLPGHGFTKVANHTLWTLPILAAELGQLLRALGVRFPVAVVGHSAGAALALRWALDDASGPSAVLGFNPSLVAPPALYTRVLGPLITPIATSSSVASLLAKIASRTSIVDNLLESTRSSIPAIQRERYARLFREPSHVRGAMGLMAAADLPAIQRHGKRLKIPLTFVLGARDEWVRERPLRLVIDRVFPSAAVQRWQGGHLLHEEEPDRATGAILDWLATIGPGGKRRIPRPGE